jgi:hypothetical protein
MMFPHARHFAVVAALVLAFSGAPRTTPAIAAPHAQPSAQHAEELGAPPDAFGETASLYGCAATLAEEPWGSSPALAEGDLEAAEGPGTESSSTPNLSVNPDCSQPSPLPPT